LPIVRALLLNLALFLLVAAALLLVATGIAYPWRPQPPVGGALAAYAPRAQRQRRPVATHGQQQRAGGLGQ
jgi:hypothetical protein